MYKTYTLIVKPLNFTSYLSKMLDLLFVLKKLLTKKTCQNKN